MLVPFWLMLNVLAIRRRIESIFLRWSMDESAIFSPYGSNFG
jgi:hypothetical protein